MDKMASLCKTVVPPLMCFCVFVYLFLLFMLLLIEKIKLKKKKELCVSAHTVLSEK